MKAHEHATKKTPDTRPARDEVAKKAYGIYLKEGRPEGRDVEEWPRAVCRGLRLGADRSERDP